MRGRRTMVDYNKTPATTLQLRRVKIFIDTSDGLVSSWDIRDGTGLHQYRVDDCLSFLFDMGLIGKVKKGTGYKYFSKLRENPNGRKSKLAGKRTEKEQEDLEIIQKIDTEIEVNEGQVLENRGNMCYITKKDTNFEDIKINEEDLKGLEDEETN